MNDLNSKNKSDGWIRLYDISMAVPSLKDNTSDVDRLVKQLKKRLGTATIRISLHLAGKLPGLFRAHKYKCNVALYNTGESWKVIDVYPPEVDRCIYGVAIDLGSSTVVVRMIDLISGNSLGDISFTNPQHEIGSDILTRIHFASENNGIDHLQGILISRINLEIKSFQEKLNISISQIVAIAAAGNTAMTHFFLGLNPYWICREPYIPVVNTPDIISPTDIGIDINREAPVIVMPGVGSYLGGDVIAGILASGMNKREETTLLVDVGTNAEVVLGNNEWLMACAGAAGPALEGGVAEIGMMAGKGAIDKVVIDPISKDFNITTIENSPPTGICGSGLIDLAAQLFLSGMIDLRGQFVEKKCSGILKDVDGVKNLIVVPASETKEGKDLLFSQTDLNALIRSKAAMYTILNTITGMANMQLDEVDRFYIAGTFGSYIDPVSAISIGMIPDLPLSKYESLGNTSIEGAAMALLSYENLKEIYKIRDMITYIELNVNQEFMNNFSAAKFIPHTDRSLFPSI